MITTRPIHPAATVSRQPRSEPRLALAATPAGRGVLDGGWWPRSWDPEAELPGLIAALQERYGSIRNIMLNRAAWDSHLRRLTVNSHVLRLGWFTTLGPALMIAVTDDGDQLELLVVPPSASAIVANHAMAAAADAANTRRAPDLLVTASSHER
jgi:Family of unknown function (DUF5994)